jgi:hypothetical protein
MKYLSGGMDAGIMAQTTTTTDELETIETIDEYLSEHCPECQSVIVDGVCQGAICKARLI